MVLLVWSTRVPFPSVVMKYDTEDHDVAFHDDDIHDDDEGEDDDDSLKHWPLAVSGHPPIVSYPQIPTLHCSKHSFKTMFKTLFTTMFKILFKTSLHCIKRNIFTILRFS